ncbi:hypothetical protein DFA_06168 [Cavenderia fasciculata]|uniref:Rab GTPase n=1 Tax=Cavenderia fasciculata TaxID=261658 RepID=F4PKA6_CACFS|nr:uncharacterized protein DFA_06168 [Cavenderia fasciculata]EGG24030.1 hypothetical protein DFA_06168 [Cavenderia fasciculata]|eukprot:XP_004361881.1 hypothetical protein DFA_06168 [Cavenderia fasciculata]
MIIKTVLIGSSCVGKTTLERKLSGKPLSDLVVTIGSEFSHFPIQIDRQPIMIELWDTFGQERFRRLPFSYYRSADFIFLVFDISNRQSFIDLPEWLDHTDHFELGKEPYTILIGNKLDLQNQQQRLVSFDEAQTFALQKGLQYIEISALHDDSCDVIKDLVCLHIKQKIKNEQLEQETRDKSFVNE